MSKAAEYKALHDLLGRLIETQTGKKLVPGEAWQNNAQVLSIKLFGHLLSMQAISNRVMVTIPDIPPFPLVDHPSVKVIARAALETYLVFYYIYSSPDPLLREFRHKTWHVGGLLDRQKLHLSMDEHRKILALEAKEIEKLQREIKSSSHFSSYIAKQQEKLLEGDWRVGNGWTNLGVVAGFNKKYFQNIYGYLCGYSHSSYASALQVRDARAVEDQEMLAQAILGIGMVIMAHFAFTYSTLFPSSAPALAAHKAAHRIAEKWRFGPEDMAEFYDR